MRTAHPFLLSLGIHLTLGALVVGVIFTAKRVIPVPQEKIALKLFEPPQEDSEPLPPIQSAAVPKSKPIPLPKPQPIAPKPLQSAPVATPKPSPLPLAPAVPAPVVAPKMVEPAPAAPIKEKIECPHVEVSPESKYQK